MYEAFGISEKIELLAEEVENEVKDVFRAIDKRCKKNSLNVLNAFQNNRISDMHFGSTTGYGCDPAGL